MVSLGQYPEVSLADAREISDEIRKERKLGQDPVRQKEKTQREITAAEANTFTSLAKDFIALNEDRWVKGHTERFRHRMEKDVFPEIGNIPVAEIGPTDVLAVLRGIERRSAVNTAHRVKGMISQVMRYGVALGYITIDPARDLTIALKSVPKPTHRPALMTPEDIGTFLKKLRAWNGNTVAREALTVVIYTFQRPGEVRLMRWEDVDMEARIWRDGVSKVSVNHSVPLSRQVMQILEERRKLTGHREHVFSNPVKPFSDVLYSQFIKKLGYSTNTVTAHGWRATARTVLDETLKYDPRFIEHQLSHAVQDANGRAYNRTLYLEERTEMMQTYADWIDTCGAQ